jgi:hypothetical protein
MPTLYHFTCEIHLPSIMIHLPSIMQEGLTRGDVPTSYDGGFNAPWLTSDSSWMGNTGWAGSGLRNGTEIDKNKFRLTVRVPDSDANLRHWPELANELEVDKAWYAALDESGGGGSDNHYVYRGSIPRSWITKVDTKVSIKVPPKGAGKGMATMQPEDTFQKGPKQSYFSVGPSGGSEASGH